MATPMGPKNPEAQGFRGKWTHWASSFPPAPSPTNRRSSSSFLLPEPQLTHLNKWEHSIHQCQEWKQVSSC